MSQLVRCTPCGYVIKESKLGEKCPACGFPRKVFKPYRERIPQNRLFILGLDLHPIAIHLSQTFVMLIPALLIITKLFPDFYYETLVAVINFSIVLLPFSLIISIITGIVDGLTRFSTLKTLLLKIKIIIGSIILVLAFVLFFITIPGQFDAFTWVLSLTCLPCAVLLGLFGKKLLNVMIPAPMLKAEVNT